jgi:hypothetical protein
MNLLRMLLTIVIIKNLKCHQINVNNVFTKSINTKIIYMSPPNKVDILNKMTLYVLKSLYGLKQATRN